MIGELDSQNRIFNIKHKPLYAAGLMILFWAIFDGIGTYSLPILMTENGLTKTAVGLIIGSSSIAGCFFDYLLGRFLKNPHYRRIYLAMLALCLIYPLILLNAKTLVFFLIAMLVWGVYYDLFGFGNFDFVSRKLPSNEHASGFGIIWVFRCLGYTIAPIIAGAVIGELVEWKPFGMMWLFLGFAILFYFLLLYLSAKDKKEYFENLERKPKPSKYEFRNVFKISKLIMPVLICTVLVNIFDAFYWTIGPLVAQDLKIIHPLDGLFIALYTLPTLLLGWFVGKVANHLGKKRTAYIAFLIGSIIVSTYALVQSTILLLGLVFISSCFFAIAWPSLNGVYSDFISESSHLEKEIESLEDFFTNIGYIVGPALAGFAADKFGNIPAFSYLGIAGIVISLILLKVTPRSIKITVS